MPDAQSVSQSVVVRKSSLLIERPPVCAAYTGGRFFVGIKMPP